MTETIKINRLQLEHVKRVSVFSHDFGGTGLTVIGGDNRQGKTSIIDAICFLLGGERYRPSNLKTDGVMSDPYLRAELSNGLLVERKGKNSALTVTDRTGKKQGQKLLDSFIEELALDLPRFLNASDKEKAATLLQILGIGEQLATMDREEQRLFDLRTEANRVAAIKSAHASQMPEHAGAPEELVMAVDLLREVRAINDRNAKRGDVQAEFNRLNQHHESELNRMAELERQLAEAKNAATMALEKMLNCGEKLASLGDVESTGDIESQLATIEETNAKVRANMDKRKAVDDATEAASKAEALTAGIELIRKQRMALLDGAKMPLPGLSVECGTLTYNGKAWDCMSSAEQMRAAVAIVRALRPECGFVLVDGLEAMDATTLAEFDQWLREQNLQCIGTRVSKGDECTLIIEDGKIAAGAEIENEQEEKLNW